MPFNRPWRFGFPMGSRPPPKAIEFGKRGGGATPVTADPSSIPATPPPSSFKHGVPKINGSEGGFIGLIVGLGVFILICCGAIYYLLRARPKKLTARGVSPQGSSSRFFSSRSKRNAGWMQQTNEFDYESTDDEAGDHPSARYAEGGKGYAGRDRQRQQGGYADPFDPEKLPESVHQQQVPLKPIQSRTPDPTISHSGEPHGADVTPKHSPTSPTFEGGTKFREQF